MTIDGRLAAHQLFAAVSEEVCERDSELVCLFVCVCGEDERRFRS
jgi:hypothetical protein